MELGERGEMRAPGCVLLDFDNTLYDYEPCHAAGKKAAGEVAHELLNFDPATFATFYEKARDEVKARLGAGASSHSRLLYFKAMLELSGLSSQPLAALQLEQAYWRAYLDQARLYPDVLTFLDDLRIAGIPVAIVTDLTTSIQLRKLIVLGLDKLVDCIITSEESGHDKPHAASFHMALDRLGLARDMPAWMIGDSIKLDLAGAKQCMKCTTFLKLASGATAQASEHVDHAFSEFSEMRAMLRKVSATAS